jgi:hypothetical protein
VTEPAEVEYQLECAECRRTPRPDENADDDWRTFYSGVGDGVTLCPRCVVRIADDSKAD